MFHGHLDYFQTYLLEVGLTQNWETMALWKPIKPLIFISLFIITHENQCPGRTGI